MTNLAFLNGTIMKIRGEHSAILLPESEYSLLFEQCAKHATVQLLAWSKNGTLVDFPCLHIF